jgi:(S)-citramalyl-CoA lyase
MSSISTIRRRRSVLFLSALALEGYADAMNSGADIVCIDLEDAVPRSRKEEGRAAILSILRDARPNDEVQLAIRINSLRSLHGVADLLACLKQPQVQLGALVLPKVQTGEELCWAGALIEEAGFHLDLYAIIETTDGLQNCYQIAKSHSRLKALLFGGFDLSTALGCTMAWDSLLYARSRVVHAAASAGIEVLDSPFPEVNNLDGLRASAERAKALGMTGKAAKDSRQVPAIVELFAPKAAEIRRARKILEIFEANPTDPLIFEGYLIELPTIQRLRSIATFELPPEEVSKDES